VWKEVVRRLLLIIPVAIGVYTVVFVMIRIVPGDPVMALVEEGVMSAERVESLRHELGLDRPVYVQYFDYMARLVRFDLGVSYTTGQPVKKMLLEALPYSVQLTLVAMLIATVLGLLTGIVSAIRHNSWADTVFMVLAVVGIATPDFWLGLLLILVFVLRLGWLPLTEVGLTWDILLLPAITLAVRPMASIARLSRASCLEVLNECYVTTARSKGLNEWKVILRHVVRNALIPVTTIIGLDLAATISNAMVIEVVFARPGIGRIILVAIQHKDFPTIQATITLSCIFYAVMNILVDLGYVALDPRLRS
jgi:peptide/nickel transport system permease protein